MANLNVSEWIYQKLSGDTGYSSISTDLYKYDYDNPVVLFDSTSVSSTGNKSFSENIQTFRLLVFCALTSGAGWKVVALPNPTFASATSDNYVIICQNIDDTNRRIHVKYVSNTTFNIGYTQNTARLVIYGIKKEE